MSVSIRLAAARRALARAGALTLLLVAAAPLAAQQPTPPAPPVANPPAAPPVTPGAPTPPRTDSLDRFLNGIPVRPLGPALFGGRVTALAVPRPYRKTMYVGTAGGGVWKTANGGITWRAVGDSIGATTIGDVAVAPSDTNVVWVGTGEKNSLRSQGWGNGVWKSVDGGRSWRSMGLAATRSIGRIVVHPRDPNTVWVAALGRLWGANAERGVYRTTDGGRTWARTLFVDDTTGAVDLEVDPSNPDVLYAATWHRIRWGGPRIQGVGPGSAIWKSTDAGRTWTRLTDPARRNGLPAERLGRIGLAVSERNPRTVYAMIQVDRGVTQAAAQPAGGVFRSDDAGATWRQVHDHQATPHYFYDDVIVDPSNAERLWVTATQLLRSDDGGRTFAAESLPAVHVDHHALWVDPDDRQHLVLGNDGGVYETRDGGRAWLHHVLPVAQAYTVTVDSSVAPYHVCAGFQDNGSWCVPSQTRDSTGVGDDDWLQVNGGDGMWVQVPWHDPHTVYSEYQFGALSRLDLRSGRRDPLQPLTIDAGAESNYPLTFGWTAPLVLSQHDSTVLWFGANRLVKFTRGGADWSLVGPDMTRTPRERPAPERGHTSYRALFSIAESPTDRGVLWTGSDDGLVWLTRDGGRTWAELSRNLPAGVPRECFVGALVASRHAPGTAYAALDCHHRDDERPWFVATRDFGASWQRLGTAGLPPDAGSHTIAEHPVNPRVLFAGTERGAWASVDGGATWRRFPRALPPVAVHRFAVHHGQRDLVIGTHGRGLWVASVAALDSLAVDGAAPTLAQRVALLPVPAVWQTRQLDTRPAAGQRPYFAPNPPRGAAISYWLREALPGPAQLVVTTLQGDTVRRIVAPGYAGLQRVVWDLTRDRPKPRALGDPTTLFELRQADPGEYLVTLTAAGQTSRQRVLVRPWPADRRGRVR